jgi:hypothetical protein
MESMAKARAALEEAKRTLRGTLDRIWRKAPEEGDEGACPCPFCGGVKIRKRTARAAGAYTTRLACASALCGAAVRGEPRPTEERAARSALSRWNRRAGGD